MCYSQERERDRVLDLSAWLEREGERQREREGKRGRDIRERERERSSIEEKTCYKKILWLLAISRVDFVAIPVTFDDSL